MSERDESTEMGPLISAGQRVKQSGLGRELGPDALDGFTDVKNVFVATDSSLTSTGGVACAV
jgi:acyl-CoA reductase-like NAD-dependent aldehyde dehydrogenase